MTPIQHGKTLAGNDPPPALREQADGAGLPPAGSWRRDVFWIAAATLTYLVVARASLLLQFRAEHLPGIWPAAGIFLAAMLLARRDLVRWVFAALLLADMSARSFAGGSFAINATDAMAAAGSAGLSLWLLRRFVGQSITLTRVREVAGWLMLSVVLSTALMSLVAATVATRVAGAETFWRSWLWSFGPAAIGNLLVTPLLLTWAATAPQAAMRRRATELAAVLVLAALSAVVLFRYLNGQPAFDLLLTYGSLPFFLWAAFRLGMAGVARVAIVPVAIGVAFAATGRVPELSFIGGAADELLVVQAAVAFMAIPALLLAAALAERTEREARLRRTDRALRMISAFNQFLVRAPGEDELMAAACRIPVAHGGYRMAWVGLAERDEARSVRPVSQAGFDDGYLDTLDITWADTERGRGPTGTAIRTGTHRVARDLATESNFEPWRADAIRRGYSSSVSLPLLANGRVLGALMLYSDRPDAFDDEEVALLDELAADLAFGMAALRERPDREAAQAALAASELRYRRLFEAARDGILILDAETGEIVDVNPYLAELVGLSRDEILGKRVWELGFLEDVAANQDKFIELRDRQYVRYDDLPLKTRGDAQVDVEFVSNVYSVAGHSVIQCNIRDISTRKAAEKALADSRRLTLEVLDAIPVRVFWKDRTLTYLGCNAAFARDAGLERPDDIVGKSDADLAWREQAARYQDDDRQTIESGEPRFLIEEPQTTPDGTTITLLTSKVPLRDAEGNVVGVLGTYLDITELKRAQAAQGLLGLAVQHAGEGMIVTDADARILEVNPAFEQITGYSRADVLGQNPRILRSGNQDAEFYRQMWAVLEKGGVWRGRVTNRRKDGTLFIQETTISPMRGTDGAISNYVGMLRDVTAQERLESQMRRTQRLESIGTLAAGLAHDLNNALTPVLVMTGMLRLELPAGALEEVDLIEAGARRGADLAKQLLQFARGAEGARLPVPLDPLFAELGRMIRHTFPKTIELRMAPVTELPAVVGDATQIHQVLLNLCINARDAMPGGGTLSLGAKVVEVGQLDEQDFLAEAPGRYVELSVSDTGTGMTPEVLEHIFEPFYTTKGPEDGTGLGLSTTLGIIKGHSGFIRVYSTPGHGSTLRVFLPAQPAAPDAAAPTVSREVAFRGHGKTILVVDDEAALRSVFRRVLTHLDFTVLTAASGAEALSLVASRGSDLAAVITDLHMPGTDGVSLVRLLRARLPEAHVIVISGLMTTGERAHFKELGVRAMLDKPFTQTDLVQVLREAFASGGPATPPTAPSATPDSTT